MYTYGQLANPNSSSLPLRAFTDLDVLAFGIARLGASDQKIKSGTSPELCTLVFNYGSTVASCVKVIVSLSMRVVGTLRSLKEEDFGCPLHSLVSTTPQVVSVSMPDKARGNTRYMKCYTLIYTVCFVQVLCAPELHEIEKEFFDMYSQPDKKQTVEPL